MLKKNISSSENLVKKEISEYFILNKENIDKNDDFYELNINSTKKKIPYYRYRKNLTKTNHFKSFLMPMFYQVTKERTNFQENQNNLLINLINKQYSGIWESFNPSQFPIGNSNKGNTIIKFNSTLEVNSRLDSIGIEIQINDGEYIDHWIKLTSFSNFKNLNKMMNISDNSLQISGNYLTTMIKGEFLETKNKQTNHCNSIINISFPLLFKEIEEKLENNLTKIKRNFSSINTDNFNLLIDSACGYKLKIEGKIYNELEEKIVKQKKLKIYFFLSLGSSIFYGFGIISLVYGIKTNEMLLSAINSECLIQNAAWNFYIFISNIYFASKIYIEYFWTFIIIGDIAIIKFIIFDIGIFFCFLGNKRKKRNK